MAQNDQNEKFAGTYRKLFDTIERGVEQCSIDRLQTLLEEKKEQLKLGLDAFGQPSSQSRSKLNSGGSITVNGKSIRLEQNEKDLICKLSDILELNEIQCAQLWEAYRQDNKEFVATFTDTNSTAQIPRLHENTEVIANVVTFYFEDRISLLECIGSLQRIALDETHPFSPLANETVNKLYEEESTTSFTKRLFDQYSKLVRTSVPKKTYSFSGWAVIWAKQNLKEQISLLEIIFLFSLSENFSPQLILSIVQEFEADSFGALQAFGYILDAEGQELREKVTYLCMLLSVSIILGRNLNVDSKLNADLSGENLLDTPDVIDKINQIVLHLGDRSEHSVFILSWSFFLTCLDAAINDEDENFTLPPTYNTVKLIIEGKQQLTSTVLINRPSVNGTEFDDRIDRPTSIEQGEDMARILTGRSLKLQVFDQITEILKSNICSEEDTNNFGYRFVLGLLFKSFLSVTRAYFLPQASYSSLVNAYCLVYKNQTSLCNIFWEKDFNLQDNDSLLETIRARFPLCTTDFTRILSSLAGNSNDETIENDPKSATHVYDYLCSISTITVVLKDDVGLTNFADDSSIEVNQPVCIIPQSEKMNSITIPEGSRGNLLNINGRLVRFPYTYSGWHFLMAVLVGYVDNYHSTLTDIEDEEYNSKEEASYAINSILELIYNVLSSNPKLGPELVQHIENTARISETASDTPILISVLCNILNYCSNIQPCQISPLTLAIKCLTLLIPHYNKTVWTYLQSSPILPRGNSGIPVHIHATHTSNPLAQISALVSKVEYTTGRYTLLLAFLDMVQGLVHDVQRNWKANEVDSLVEDNKYHIDILYLCLHYIMLEVFPTYTGWRYEKISECYLIGNKIFSIFIEIALGFKEPISTSAKSDLTLSGIRSGLFKNFLYDGGAYHISPLLDTISEGAKKANLLYKISRPKEAQRIEKLTELTFVFIKLLLQHRLEEIKDGSTTAESTLEHLLLERSVGGNSSDFLLRIAKHINYRHNIALRIQATNVLSLLCRTSSTWKTIPNFVQYLGSTDQIHAIIRAYLSIAKDHFQTEELLSSVWQLMTVLLETQPSLAILFLDCGDFIMPSPKSDTRVLSNGTGSTSTAATAPASTSESAIRAATDILNDWEALSVQKPTVMSNVLRFLSTFWQTAFDHYAIVERTRADPALWDLLAKVLLNPNNEMDVSAQNLQNIDLVQPESTEDRLDINVRRQCCLNLSKAFVMSIISYEAHLTADNAKIQGNTASSVSDRLPPGLRNLLSKINEPSKLTSLLQMFTKGTFNPVINKEVKTAARDLLAFYGTGSVTSLLFKMSHIGTGDDNAAGEARQYGDSYLYDYQIASNRVRSLYEDASSDCNLDDTDSMDTPEVQAALDVKRNANKFLASVLEVNYSSSIVDSEIISLRAFKTFIEVLSSRSTDLIWANKPSVSGTESLYNFTQSLIKHTQKENRADGVSLTFYSILVNLVRSLTEDWINKNRDVLMGTDADAKRKFTQSAFNLLSSLCGLLDRENFALMDSISDRTAIRFHNPLLESIMLCLRTLSGSTGQFDSANPNAVERQTCLARLLSVVCQSFHVLVIQAGSYSAKGTTASDEAQENCIKDVTVVVTLLQELISSKCNIPQDIWLPIFAENNTISSLLALFTGGLEVLVNEVKSQSPGSSGIQTLSITPYAESSLYFLLALSNIPRAAETLVSNNIFGLLSNNVLTPHLQVGELDLFIRFAEGNKNGPGYVERNPLHFVWCQILAVVGNLMRTTGNSEEVLQKTVTFMQVYGPQIGKAFQNANGLNDSTFGLMPSESLSSPLLEEIQYITMIFFGLSKYLERLPNIANNLFVSFKDCALFLFQRYLYFFTHPSHMQAQLYPIDNIERQQAQKFESATTPATSSSTSATTTASARDQRAGTSLLTQKILKSTMIITHYMLTTLINLTNADVILTTRDTEWPFGNTIIYPDMRVTVGEIASFGTLTECISSGIAMLSKEKYPVQQILHVVQDSAVLLVAQLLLWIAKPNIKEETRIEIGQDNIMDVVENINKAEAALQKLDEAGSVNVKSRLSHLRTLQKILSHRYFSQEP